MNSRRKVHRDPCGKLWRSCIEFPTNLLLPFTNYNRVEADVHSHPHINRFPVMLFSQETENVRLKDALLNVQA